MEHAEEWLLFSKNIGKKLSLDEVSISNGELYTVLTNKEAKGGKGALVAIIKGTKTTDIRFVLDKITKEQRQIVKEVTLDFCPNMESSIRASFPKAEIVADRFHAQQLVSEVVQEQRIKLRWKAIEQENRATKKARQQKKTYRPKTYANGDTKKQLLARSRYLLFKPENKWTESQRERAKILFVKFPELKDGYNLSMMFRSFYEHALDKHTAQKRLNQWYQKVSEKNIDSFMIAAGYIKNHQEKILNYFNNRSTNASAESFNAKLKGFRALVRGVRDKKFFLFRVAKIYA